MENQCHPLLDIPLRYRLRNERARDAGDVCNIIFVVRMNEMLSQGGLHDQI